MTIKEIQKLIKEFEESKLTELELEYKEVKLRLSKNKNNDVINKSDIIEENKYQFEEISLPTQEIKSPLVGTFYAASRPDAKPLVEIGQEIQKGDVVCIIEAMKIMNEITSSVSGIVETIHFENGEVVGFNDSLFTVKTYANGSK